MNRSRTRRAATRRSARSTTSSPAQVDAQQDSSEEHENPSGSVADSTSSSTITKRRSTRKRRSTTRSPSQKSIASFLNSGDKKPDESEDGSSSDGQDNEDSNSSEKDESTTVADAENEESTKKEGAGEPDKGNTIPGGDQQGASVPSDYEGDDNEVEISSQEGEDNKCVSQPKGSSFLPTTDKNTNGDVSSTHQASGEHMEQKSDKLYNEAIRKSPGSPPQNPQAEKENPVSAKKDCTTVENGPTNNTNESQDNQKASDNGSKTIDIESDKDESSGRIPSKEHSALSSLFLLSEATSPTQPDQSKKSPEEDDCMNGEKYGNLDDNEHNRNVTPLESPSIMGEPRSDTTKAVPAEAPPAIPETPTEKPKRELTDKYESEEDKDSAENPISKTKDSNNPIELTRDEVAGSSGLITDETKRHAGSTELGSVNVPDEEEKEKPSGKIDTQNVKQSDSEIGQSTSTDQNNVGEADPVNEENEVGNIESDREALNSANEREGAAIEDTHTSNSEHNADKGEPQSQLMQEEARQGFSLDAIETSKITTSDHGEESVANKLPQEIGTADKISTATEEPPVTVEEEDKTKEVPDIKGNGGSAIDVPEASREKEESEADPKATISKLETQTKKEQISDAQVTTQGKENDKQREGAEIAVCKIFEESTEKDLSDDQPVAEVKKTFEAKEDAGTRDGNCVAGLMKPEKGAETFDSPASEASGTTKINHSSRAVEKKVPSPVQQVGTVDTSRLDVSKEVVDDRKMEEPKGRTSARKRKLHVVSNEDTDLTSSMEKANKNRLESTLDTVKSSSRINGNKPERNTAVQYAETVTSAELGVQEDTSFRGKEMPEESSEKVADPSNTEVFQKSLFTCLSPEVLSAFRSNFARLEQIKMRLYVVGTTVHRGSGAERLFSDYWDALCRIVAFQVNDTGKNETSSLNRARGMLQKFLKTKQLKKLHNSLILAIMEKCMKDYVPDQGILSKIPIKWRKRVKRQRVTSETYNNCGAFSTGNIARLSGDLFLRRQDTTDNQRWRSLFGPQSDIWSAGGLGRPAPDLTLSDTPKSSYDVIGEVTSSKNLSASLPGAVAIDPLVRGLAQDEGLRVSENAVWLMVIAVREYTASILKNTIMNAELLNENQVSPAPLNLQPNMLTAKSGSRKSASRKAALRGKEESNVGPVSTTQNVPPESRKRRLVTSLDISSFLSGMPISGSAALGGTVSRLGFERCYATVFDSTPVFPQKDFQVVQNFISSEIVEDPPKRQKVEDPPKRQKAEEKDPPMRQKTEETPNRQKEEEAVVTEKGDPKLQKADAQKVQRPVVRGMGRGAKNLAALRARAISGSAQASTPIAGANASSGTVAIPDTAKDSNDKPAPASLSSTSIAVAEGTKECLASAESRPDSITGNKDPAPPSDQDGSEVINQGIEPKSKDESSTQVKETKGSSEHKTEKNRVVVGRGLGRKNLAAMRQRSGTNLSQETGDTSKNDIKGDSSIAVSGNNSTPNTDGPKIPPSQEATGKNSNDFERKEMKTIQSNVMETKAESVAGKPSDYDSVSKSSTVPLNTEKGSESISVKELATNSAKIRD